nr:phage terminase small subunit [Edwardsiella ictaluri]
MMTPARRHLLRHQALAANMQENQTYASGYELMLAKLATDKRRLKAIQSIERKIEVKGELLPDYQPWVSGVLASDSKQQDDVFMTVLLWTLDTGNFPAAYPMAEHAIRHGWQTPDQYRRQTACMVAEEVADTALKQLIAGTFEALDSCWPSPDCSPIRICRIRFAPACIKHWGWHKAKTSRRKH